MKKVLFVIRELSGGGAERALSNIMENFPEDWDMDILMNNRDYIGFPCKANILSLDISEPKSRNSIMHQIWCILKRTWYLNKIKKTNHYVACISFLDSSNISNILSGNKYCKTIISIRSMITDRTEFILRVCTDILMRIIYRNADKIVTVSREIGDSIKQKYHLREDQVITIVNGYNCEKIEKDSKQQLEDAENSFFRNNKVIVSVGRLANPKGHWHLIRAFQKVVEAIPNAKLFIIGNGELQTYLEELIKTCRLERSVILFGFTDNPFKYVRNASCFVLPSIYEGFPNALAEAICCNIPCIATDFHSGAREILDPGLDVLGKRTDTVLEAQYGILTPLCSGIKYKDGSNLEDQEQKLADAIIELLKNDGKRTAYQRQSNKRKQDLDIKTVIEQWISLIRE